MSDIWIVTKFYHASVMNTKYADYLPFRKHCSNKVGGEAGILAHISVISVKLSYLFLFPPFINYQC